MADSALEKLKIRWYNLAIKGEPVIGEDQVLFDSLPEYAQAELKKAYILGANDESETWMNTTIETTKTVLIQS